MAHVHIKEGKGLLISLSLIRFLSFALSRILSHSLSFSFFLSHDRNSNLNLNCANLFLSLFLSPFLRFLCYFFYIFPFLYTLSVHVRRTSDRPGNWTIPATSHQSTTMFHTRPTGTDWCQIQRTVFTEKSLVKDHGANVSIIFYN